MKNSENHGASCSGSDLSCFLFEAIEVVAQSFVFVVFMLVFVFRIFTVQGGSMLNTLHNGDKVFVWQYGYVPHDGDIVVISKYGNLRESIIKRVIATEGQSLHIDFDSCSVIVDGKKLNEYYINEAKFGPDDGHIPSVVPKGYCFVMGDNRNHSSDSRSVYVGLVPVEKVVGVAKSVYFPFHRIRSLPRAV